jgi:ferredoxin
MATVSLNGSPPAPIAIGGDLLGAMLDGGQPAMYLCMSGSCGTCRVRVASGADALAAMNRAEIHHRCGGTQRLACQARVARDADITLVQPA